MRYFLHQIQTFATVRDPEGCMHPDLASVHIEAVDAARQMMSTAVLRGRDISGWTFEIADRKGIVLERLPFASTLVSA